MQISLQDVQQALALSQFDVQVARQKMTPQFRVNRRPPQRAEGVSRDRPEAHPKEPPDPSVPRTPGGLS